MNLLRPSRLATFEHDDAGRSPLHPLAERPVNEAQCPLLTVKLIETLGIEHVRRADLYFYTPLHMSVIYANGCCLSALMHVLAPNAELLGEIEKERGIFGNTGNNMVRQTE